MGTWEFVLSLPWCFSGVSPWFYPPSLVVWNIYIYVYIYISIYLYLYPCFHICAKPTTTSRRGYFGTCFLVLGQIRNGIWMEAYYLQLVGFPSRPTTEYPQLLHQGQRTPPNILLFLPLVTPKITHSKFSLQKKNKGGRHTYHITTWKPQNQGSPDIQSWPIPRHSTS